MRQQYRIYEQGVASLFIVMFAILLLVTVSVGFMQIMMSEQIRSSDNELSQGAYDSALAGVEDGKRVITACMKSGYDQNNDACKAINARECKTVSAAKLANPESNGEVYLKTANGANGTDYQQAYTCVKIQQQTAEYRGSMSQSGDSAVVPLTTASTDSFVKVRLFWRIPNVSTVGLPSADITLPKLADWSGGATNPPRPALMRTQLIQYKKDSIDPDSFDLDGNGHTLYFSPNTTPSPLVAADFAADARRSGTLQPTIAKCTTLTINQGYNCVVEISVPNPVGGDPTSRQAYLRLTSIYTGADFMIQLLDTNNNIVKFDGVQPSIDSTGRAGDVFRRVDARVELVDPNESKLYPRATVDITKNFCKTFSVSTDAADYSDGVAVCNPAQP